LIVAATDRLTLRRLTLGDGPAFMELTNEPEVRRYTGADPYASVVEAERMIGELLARYERDDFGRWAVIRREDGEFLGWCGLRPIEREGVDLGFWIHPRHWNQGATTFPTCSAGPSRRTSRACAS
jgi:RimJ/RimL family protein N-acetyltransferase